MCLASVSSLPPNIQHNDHTGSVTDNECQFFQHIQSANTTFHLPRCNNPRPLSDLGYHSECQLHELSKCPPLPAIKSDCWTTQSTTSYQHTAKVTASIDSIDSGYITGDSPQLTAKCSTAEELDVFLQLFDRSVVLVWLEQTKRSITDISDWCAEGKNFICFARFWLSELPSDHRCSMFEFEYGLLRDKIASSCRNKQPSLEQLAAFLTAILHEFPGGRLNGLSGAYMFLEHLEAVAERRKRESLLAAVTYSSHNRQNYDCLLAVRSYAIVTIWSAILDKYRSGVDSVMVASKKKTRPSKAQVRSTQSLFMSSASDSSRPSTASSELHLELMSLEDEVACSTDISSQKRVFDAIRLVYVLSASFLSCTWHILTSR